VPVWPNLTAQPAILGATVTRVPLQVRDGAWTLDLDALLARVTDAPGAARQRAEQPDRLDADRAEQQAILAHCRRTGTWIVADEVYERIYFEPARRRARRASSTSPSRTIAWSSSHSFSKSFLMTGWRLGWLVVPPAMDADSAS
jgi:aspartate/methionine/tyrosine aminotransferase